MTKIHNQPYDTPTICKQQWQSSCGTFSRSGDDLARMVLKMGVFAAADDAATHFATSRIGDTLKTGVSAYTRTE